MPVTPYQRPHGKPGFRICLVKPMMVPHIAPSRCLGITQQRDYSLPGPRFSGGISVASGACLGPNAHRIGVIKHVPLVQVFRSTSLHRHPIKRPGSPYTVSATLVHISVYRRRRLATLYLHSSGPSNRNVVRFEKYNSSSSWRSFDIDHDTPSTGCLCDT